MSTGRWFHPNLSGQQAEDELFKRGTDGSFLTRPSQNNPGDFTLSVRRGNEVTHVRIQNQGEFYDLYGGEKFASLAELVQYYLENPGQLREKNGVLIELKQALNCEEVTNERWYHGTINGREAEALLMDKGSAGSFLVRASTHSPGDYVISVQVDGEVTHVIIKRKNGKFDVGGGPSFSELQELIEHYKKTPLVETNGRVINLRMPFHATSFLPSSIKQRYVELEKQTQEVGGKAAFWEEFEQVQQQECRHLYSRKEGSRPENKSKNRYKNILPFDHTRVVLKDCDPNVVGSDYINANFVSGETAESERRYIATQGCLTGTINSFWKMIWQERVMVIVMTTNEVERGRNKCARYWSDTNESKTYDKIHVLNLKEVSNPHYVMREFLLNHDSEGDGGEGRHLFHYHFKAWPDHGVPQDPGAVLGFLQDINLRQEQITKNGLNPGPILVHCSAGIGRTGTFIVIDIILNVMEVNGWDAEIDIQKSIQLVRSQRSGMVQTDQQYRFVYKSILHHVETQTQLKQAGSGGASQPSHYTIVEDPLYGNVPKPAQS